MWSPTDSPWSPIESPLNQAHQLARQADLYVKSSKFEEALSCHKRAAEHILDAMLKANSDQAKDSLQLQHRHHNRQQEIIRQKEKQVRQEELKKSDPSQSPSAGLTHSTSDSQKADLEHHIDPTTLYRTIEESDTLIQFLMRRNQLQPPKNMNAMSACLPVSVAGPAQPVMTKMPKDDKQLIEELQIQNEDLRKHILLLLKEVEGYQLLQKDIENHQEDNEALRLKVEKLEKKLCDVNCEKQTANEIQTFVELTPLETPQFNYEDMPFRGLYKSSKPS